MEDVAERGGGWGRGRMRGGRRVIGRAGRGGHGQRRQQPSNELRATLVGHVINHGWHCERLDRECSLSHCRIFFLQFSFSLHRFVSIWIIWRILYNLNYFSIWQSTLKMECFLLCPTVCSWLDKIIRMKCVPSGDFDNAICSFCCSASFWRIYEVFCSFVVWFFELCSVNMMFYVTVISIQAIISHLSPLYSSPHLIMHLQFYVIAAMMDVYVRVYVECLSVQTEKPVEAK